MFKVTIRMRTGDVIRITRDENATRALLDTVTGRDEWVDVLLPCGAIKRLRVAAIESVESKAAERCGVPGMVLAAKRGAA